MDCNTCTAFVKWLRIILNVYLTYFSLPQKFCQFSQSRFRLLMGERWIIHLVRVFKRSRGKGEGKKKQPVILSLRVAFDSLHPSLPHPRALFSARAPKKKRERSKIWFFLRSLPWLFLDHFAIFSRDFSKSLKLLDGISFETFRIPTHALQCQKLKSKALLSFIPWNRFKFCDKKAFALMRKLRYI